MPKRAKEYSSSEARRLTSGVQTVGGVARLLIRVATHGAQSWLLRVSSTYSSICFNGLPPPEVVVN